MEKIIVGIDPGNNTGFALWDKDGKKFINVLTVSFWEAISLLKELLERKHLGLTSFKVFIEDVTQNKPVFARTGVVQKGVGRIAQNVGMNKRDCQLLIEWCENNNVEVNRLRPTKKSLTKLDKEQFKKITNYQGVTSEHARDAAMLVYGR